MNEIQWIPVKPNYKNQLRVGNSLFLGPFFIAALVAAIWLEKLPTWIPLAVATAIFVLWITLVLFWAPARCRVTSYALETDVVRFRLGALWHRETAVTHNRLQHLEIERGPVERMLGLSRLKLFTAGGMGSDLTIPGLAPEVAEDIRNNLIAKIRDEVLEDGAITSASSGSASSESSSKSEQEQAADSSPEEKPE
ncbi:hypothetical protein CWE08_06845 [Aliidiomarina iranensis]|uniref:YdbS-like PH domain-containing protein n=1 Tax=Aliidiomarina iranensis TaxID=1434071 RepID=A0A432VW44_9GAMM|nr:PH domain-containing protein [Aliidiomarina iranensis]RUO20812.1 hypothetical protein CWE08_06845 [Aliidiomarina iranensis]